MSKKKKFFVICFVLLLIGGGVFLAINLLSPKADLSAPYKNFYDIVNNEKLDNIDQNNDNMLDYLSKMTTFENENMKQTASALLQRYQIVDVVFDVYDKTNYTFQTNFAYMSDGENFVEVQRAMTKSHKTVLEKYETLNNFINTQIKPIKTRGDQYSWDMLNTLSNYDVLFVDFISEFANFYACAGDCFAYATDSMQANPYSKQNMKSITTWAKSTINFVINNQYDGVLDGVNNLEDFTASALISNPNVYFENFEVFDEIISTTNQLGQEAYDALAKNGQYTYLQEVADETQKEKLQNVFENYFEVDLTAPQGGEQ